MPSDRLSIAEPHLTLVCTINKTTYRITLVHLYMHMLCSSKEITGRYHRSILGRTAPCPLLLFVAYFILLPSLLTCFFFLIYVHATQAFQTFAVARRSKIITEHLFRTSATDHTARENLEKNDKTSLPTTMTPNVASTSRAALYE